MLLLTNKLFYIYLLYFQELDVIKDPIERQATDAWLKLANDKGVCIASLKYKIKYKYICYFTLCIIYGTEIHIIILLFANIINYYQFIVGPTLAYMLKAVFSHQLYHHNVW